MNEFQAKETIKKMNEDSKVDVYFTVGTNNNNIVVPFGEPHYDLMLANSIAKMGQAGYKDVHVVHYRTNNARQLFNHLQCGIN